MGFGRWDDSDWDAHRQATSTKTRDQIFTARGLKDALDPAKIKFRESRDSQANPLSTPIVLAVDVTGSMGHLAETIVRKGLGTIMSAIYDKKPVPDPHILCAAIGDANTDSTPLQVTQFESEVEPLTKQVMDLWLEGNGGGNGGESYALAWAFVAAKTRCDAIKKGRKGYIFTIGDEACHDTVTKTQLDEFLGKDAGAEADLHAKPLLKKLQEHWHVFHLITPTATTREQDADKKWRGLLGERAIVVDDYEHLAEGIVATLQLTNGSSKHDVDRDWHDNPVVLQVTRQLAMLPA